MTTMTKKMVEALDGLLDQSPVLFRRGRFACVDTYQAPPADPISLHKYLYAGADPVNRIHPSGLFPGLDVLGYASFVVGAADYQSANLTMAVLSAAGSTDAAAWQSAFASQQTGIQLMQAGGHPRSFTQDWV